MDLRGTYSHYHSNGNAIWVSSSAAAGKADGVVELGPTAVIRQAEGSDGVNGIYVEQRSAEGDIRIDLAAGSLIDVSTSGGRGLNAFIVGQNGDILIDAAGTIRAAVRHRPVDNRNQGIGISAFHTGEGRIRIASSGTVETWQANAIFVLATAASGGAHRDDPATAEIEGHLIDVTGGKVHTRGGTAIFASTASADAAFTVRVAEGATVRAERDAGPDAITQEQLGADGNSYVFLQNVYGWRRIDTDDDGENDAIEPVVNAIAVTRSATAPSEGVTDRVIVHGAVAAVGGKEGVDSAIFMRRGGAVFVGATGRVSADSGLAISSGVAPPAEPPENYEPEASDLDVTVAGTVTGDIRVLDDGALTLSVPEGGVVTGTVHDPVGPLTVAGSIGRLLYSGGATVTVPAAGRLTGVEVDGRTEALRGEAGVLSMTVAGRVTGDVLGRGMGDHMVTVARGGAVTGTIHLAASTVRVDGSVGCVRLDRGGVVTVGASGRIACADGGIRSETGDLTATVAGRVEGDVFALGSGEHRVAVAAGGAVTGAVRVATRSAVTLMGAVGKARLDRGGTVMVGTAGRVTGMAGDATAIRSDAGELAVTIQQAAGETAQDVVNRLPGRIWEYGGSPEVSFQAVGVAAPRRLGMLGGAATAPLGARDLGLAPDGAGVRLAQDYAPRSRVYEALPSVLLGLNVAPAHRDRLAGQRSPNGMWVRAEATGGERQAKRSTSTFGPGIAYDHHGWGMQTGVDFPLGREGLVGVSAHHRRGVAKLSGGDGRIQASGSGFGLSGAWTIDGDVYVDGQFEATWYEADLSSGRRGALKSGAKGFGWSAVLEAGRRVGLGPGLLGEMTLTPRARLARSNVEVKGFTDSVGSRVSVGGGRSLSGRVGVEMSSSGEGGSRLFGSLELEREFSPDTRSEVSGEGLSSEGVATRVLTEIGVAHSWDEGRYALQGVAHYAAARGGNRGYGGGLSLSIRF